MDELEGEGMFTLTDLKILLEREIANRLRSIPGTAEQTPRVHHSVDRIFARQDQPAPEEGRHEPSRK